MDIDDFPVRVLATVEAIAAGRGQGALLVLEAERSSLERLRRGGACDERLGAQLRHASSAAASLLPTAEWARTAWSRFECALPGPREELEAAAQALVAGLLARPELKGLRWRAVLTHIFPGEALRTLYCDPEDALAGKDTSLVAWVEPYAGDDWQELQRHPTTTTVWQAD